MASRKGAKPQKFGEKTRLKIGGTKKQKILQIEELMSDGGSGLGIKGEGAGRGAPFAVPAQ
jgi:hypothetical protein